MIPLNIYLHDASPRPAMEHAVIEYGNAIKDLVAPTSSRATCCGRIWRHAPRQGGVLRLRRDRVRGPTVTSAKCPSRANEEEELSGEVLVPRRAATCSRDLRPFLLGHRAVREVFMKHHADPLDAAFWQGQRPHPGATCTTCSPTADQINPTPGAPPRTCLRDRRPRRRAWSAPRGSRCCEPSREPSRRKGCRGVRAADGCSPSSSAVSARTRKKRLTSLRRLQPAVPPTPIRAAEKPANSAAAPTRTPEQNERSSRHADLAVRACHLVAPCSKPDVAHRAAPLELGGTTTCANGRARDFFK